jgi:hypothetical protein
MNLLTREQILQANDLESRDVAVPEWGGTLRVRVLTGTERDAVEASTLQGKGKSQSVNLSNFRAKLCARAIVDEQGKRLFSDEDIAALGKKSAGALSRVYNVAAELSGISEADVDELIKNSASGQSADSGSS